MNCKTIVTEILEIIHGRFRITTNVTSSLQPSIWDRAPPMMALDHHVENCVGRVGVMK